MDGALVSDSSVKNGWGGWRPNSGRPRRDDWQDAYLDRIRQYGTKIRSAREVGVPWSVVWEECDRNPAFADALREASQDFADGCEEILLAQGMGLKGNPLPVFALLKKHRPSEYVEKAMTFNVDVVIDVPSDQARQVLGEMLAHVTPATVERLTTAERSDDAASGAKALNASPTGLVATHDASGHLILDATALGLPNASQPDVQSSGNRIQAQSLAQKEGEQASAPATAPLPLAPGELAPIPPQAPLPVVIQAERAHS